MKFTVDSKILKEAIESIQVKGKSTTNNGFGNSSLGNYANLTLTGNNLQIWNGNSTFCVKITLTVEGEQDGSCVVDVSMVVPYLTSFGENTVVNVDDFMSLSSGRKKASVPLITNHPNEQALDTLKNMLLHINYTPNPNVLFNFGKSKFEVAFTISQEQLNDAIKTCELVKTGVYKFDFNKSKEEPYAGTLEISSRQNATNKYDEIITPVFRTGDGGATLEFSSPIHKFFQKGQMLNIYMKDEFPLLIVSNDRLLLKAPFVSGD